MCPAFFVCAFVAVRRCCCIIPFLSCSGVASHSKKISAFYECSYFLLASYLFECLLSLSFFLLRPRRPRPSFLHNPSSPATPPSLCLLNRASIQLGSRYRTSAFRFENRPLLRIPISIRR
ncbi:hypothetical protein BJ912DRAFT_995698 [Pholiota molesta]|nr:hypothetical protein BJ912DRAFT_995698 [Pholiota molesta]